MQAWKQPSFKEQDFSLENRGLSDMNVIIQPLARIKAFKWQATSHVNQGKKSKNEVNCLGTENKSAKFQYLYLFGELNGLPIPFGVTAHYVSLKPLRIFPKLSEQLEKPDEL